MCRHIAYLGPSVPLAELLLDPPFGLLRQSWQPRRQQHGRLNADGFGVAFFEDKACRLFIDNQSAGTSPVVA